MTNHQHHVELWTWLSENPTKCKSDWPKWKKNGEDVPEVWADCFACQEHKNGGRPCDNPPHCVLDWTQEQKYPDKLVCSSTGSLFNRYRFAQTDKDWEETSKLALQIANLTWRDWFQTEAKGS